MRVLLLEDDEVYGFMIEHHLRECYNAYVERYYSAKEGEENANRSFDVIIVDYTLSDTTAMSLVDGLLKDFKSVPILVLSGTSDTNVVQQLLEMGVFAFVNKGSRVIEGLEENFNRLGFKTYKNA